MTSGLPVNGEGIPPNGPHVPVHPMPVMGNALQVALQKPGEQGRTQDKPHLGMVPRQPPDNGAGAKPMGTDAGVEQHGRGGLHRPHSPGA